ncbi:MAG: acyl-CoA reductase-like NAD-dependent aldehyde dehydrogenase [Halieaceae bacterium]|jgi:acyl-CoA reductase-like NAD-dependent aldehyde dehydrogenase
MSIYEPIESNDSRRHLQLRSPITLETSGELICANKEDVAAAVARARAAQGGWAALSFDERAVYMNRALKIVLEKQDEIVDTVVGETGKARSDALAMEIFAVADSLCYYAKNAKKFLKPEKKKVHGVLGFLKKLKIVYKPRGVVGIITPWNGPFVLAMNPAIQALMAGNAVIVKGSEVTPYSTKMAETVFTEAGLPEGVFQVLMGDGETGAALVESGLDKISFTGSVATGRRVAESCGRQLIPCTMELGGNDAMVVCADANIERAASGALIGACMNTGHYCCGTERIYVVASVYDAFVERVVELTKELRQGSELGYDEDVGAVFWDRQMTIIEDHVADAKARGATILVGGQRNPNLTGLYFEPTVMTDVTHEMDIMKHETFGPILCIQKVADEAEAIRLANDSDFGLNGNVWTNDAEKGFQLATQIDTGSASVNDMACSYGVPAAPFGGRKLSGVGQVNGECGLKGFCHAMPVVIDKSTGDKLGAAYPYTTDKAEGLKKLMNILWIKTPIGRWLS